MVMRHPMCCSSVLLVTPRIDGFGERDRMESLSRRIASKRGYSLTEVMMVVSIVGLMAAMVYPDMKRQAAGSRLEDSASDVVGLLRAAREEAIGGNLDVEVNCSTNANRVTWRADYDRNGIIETDEVRDEAFSTESGVSWTMPNGWAAFTSRGMFRSGGGGHWELRAQVPDGRQRFIYLVPSGQIIQSVDPISSGGP
jgi:prepilin-type N-terminal cleavage/methylation domain-containing protein